MGSRYLKPMLGGLVGALGLLGFYFGILTLISGWNFALNQFATFWYFILSLAFGFGAQLGLYIYLRNEINKQAMSGKMVVVSGTTSTVAMVSCCAHYLTNIIPIIGLAGAISLISQYQVELFWFGLAANVLGIGYIVSRIRKFSQP